MFRRRNESEIGRASRAVSSPVSGEGTASPDTFKITLMTLKTDEVVCFPRTMTVRLPTKSRGENDAIDRREHTGEESKDIWRRKRTKEIDRK